MDLAKSLAFSAVGGLVVGVVGCGGDGKKVDEPSADSSAVPAADTAAAAADASGAKPCCKGMNECKGKGGCKTADHECAGKNDCGKKGGCKKHPDRPECADAP